MKIKESNDIVSNVSKSNLKHKVHSSSPILNIQCYIWQKESVANSSIEHFCSLQGRMSLL